MRKYLFFIKQFLLFIARFVLFLSGNESECVVCGCKTYLLPICNECNQDKFNISSFFIKRCHICGKQLISEQKFCTTCRVEPLLKSTDEVFSLFSYRLWNINLLCRWKLNEERILSDFFSSKLNEKLLQIKEKMKIVIVPVPPRPNKIKIEGWDQIQEISEFLEFKFNYNVQRILERRSVIEQKTLDREQRLCSIGKSYFLKNKIKEIPETVCLIDDVITTGSTVESCARVLKEAGVKKVIALSLFTVDN